MLKIRMRLIHLYIDLVNCNRKNLRRNLKANYANILRKFEVNNYNVMKFH